MLTCDYHGCALRHQERHHEVAHLALAHRQDGGVRGATLHAAVPAVVVVATVVVVLAVCVVALAIVRHQVMQREAVVSHNEVDALVRMPALTVQRCSSGCVPSDAAHRAAPPISASQYSFQMSYTSPVKCGAPVVLVIQVG